MFKTVKYKTPYNLFFFVLLFIATLVPNVFNTKTSDWWIIIIALGGVTILFEKTHYTTTLFLIIISLFLSTIYFFEQADTYFFSRRFFRIAGYGILSVKITSILFHNKKQGFYWD